MDILITTKSQTTAGPTVNINCPICNAAEVPAESYEQLDSVGLFYLIPLFRLRNTFVRCTACERQLIAKLTIDEIANYSAEELGPHIVRRVSFVGKCLALLSIVLCWAPFVGLVLGIVSLVANLRTVGWPRTLSWIGTILSLLVSIAFLILLALN